MLKSGKNGERGNDDPCYHSAGHQVVGELSSWAVKKSRLGSDAVTSGERCYSKLIENRHLRLVLLKDCKGGRKRNNYSVPVNE